MDCWSWWRINNITDKGRLNSAEIFKQSVRARNRVGIGLSYRPTRARSFKRFWSLGIDSKYWIPPAYVAWRAGTITLFLLRYSPHRLFKNSVSDGICSSELILGLLVSLKIRGSEYQALSSVVGIGSPPAPSPASEFLIPLVLACGWGGRRGANSHDWRENLALMVSSKSQVHVIWLRYRG
jgi:hypothetical protein